MPFRLFSSIWLVIYSFQSFGQFNLVPNPSFEDLIDCPFNFGENNFYLASPWFSSINTPDIFNSCAGSMSGTFGVPINNQNCFQYPKTGNGYAGFANHFTISLSTEFPEVKLISKLKENKKYFISFYVSSQNCSNPDICFSDGLDLAFSDTAYIPDPGSGVEIIPPFTPAVSNPNGIILKDTLGWMEISGCYVAKGDEQYIIIGNFDTYDKTQSEGCVGVTGSYYYLDDVGVYEFDIVPDTILLCSGESKKIGKKFLDAGYHWNTGSQDSTILISEAGMYTIDVKLGNCTMSDTAIVIRTVEPGTVQAIDTILCEGEDLILKAPLPGTYTWNNGVTDAQITINEAGNYTVNILNECGHYSSIYSVEKEQCECQVFLPNIFSPNYDGINDLFEPSVGCDFPYSNRNFRIFNRWGAEVYASKSSYFDNIKWDGTFRGVPVIPDVYIWIWEYEYLYKGSVIVKRITGSITLIR